MMKNLRAAGAILTSLFLLSVTVALAASPAEENSIVQENKEKLLKTKSCPGCDLAGVNLNRADLVGADLQGANLTKAKFFLANLAGANLQKARLQGAGFGGADLADADFRGADLRDVSLSGAYYRGAHFDKEFTALLRKGDAGSSEIAAEETATIEPEAAETKTPTSEQVGQPSGQPAVKVKAASPSPVAASQEPRAAARPAQRDAKQQVQVVGATDPGLAPQNIEEKKPEEPPPPAVARREAPPVKTVRPPGAIVIAEQATAGKTSESIEKMTVAKADRAAATKEAVQTGSTRGKVVELANETPATASDPGGGAKVSQALSADQEKMANLARLVKSKKCFACDLSGMDLSNMRLAKADFEKADLSDCNLEGADLGAANLKGANLRRANLKKANLKGADLYKADLTAADLSGAEMKNAQVDEALFSGAIGVSEEILQGRN
jgi:uncharacterized protein YjbI with pentapeptide repeats